MAETRTNTAPPSNNPRKSRVNPVEIVILMTVGLVLCNSVYNLFYNTQKMRPVALTEMSANPILESRAPAGMASSFGSATINCDRRIEKDTSASKIRISGPLCSSAAKTTAAQLGKATVLNKTNNFSATVFTDPNTAEFSTDYIPLATGKNEIRVEYSLKTGGTVSQEIEITRL